MDSRRRTALPIRALGIALAVTCAACADPLSEGCQASDPPAAPQPLLPSRQYDLDSLRNLGYVGFSEDEVTPGENPVPILDPERTCPGFTLYSNRNLCSAKLIDVQGRVVRSWSRPTGRHWSNVELLESGDLMVIGSDFLKDQLGSFTHYLARYSWEGEELWRTVISAHHDVEQTPEGVLATLTYEFRRIAPVHAGVDTEDNSITLLTPEGRVVEEYSLYELLASDPEIFELQTVRPKLLSGKFRVDLIHANSVEFMHREELFDRDPIYAAGNVLVSMRHQDAVAIFDLSARKIVWAWGQGDILGPHDATVLENGNVLLFDNGLGRGWSRVIELDPLTREIVWEFKSDVPEEFYSASRGSNQRLPNGNTLIANSDAGEALEVTPEGEVVWMFQNPGHDANMKRATIVRAKRHPVAFVERLLGR